MNLFAPKSKFEVGECVVYNRNYQFGNKDDKILLIESKEYKKTKFDLQKEWYYSGKFYLLKSTVSLGVSQIPIYSENITGISERNLRKLEEILVKEN